MVDSTFIRPSNNWIAAADQLVSEDKAIAHAVVIFVRGSSPREVGANMVISETQIWNTIGGGSLEFEVMKQARSLIKENSHIAKSSYRRVLNLALGPVDGWGEYKRTADLIALSKMTFPHELAAVMLVEQVYRATEIIKGTNYHRV